MAEVVRLQTACRCTRDQIANPVSSAQCRKSAQWIDCRNRQCVTAFSRSIMAECPLNEWNAGLERALNPVKAAWIRSDFTLLLQCLADSGLLEDDQFMERLNDPAAKSGYHQSTAYDHPAPVHRAPASSTSNFVAADRTTAAAPKLQNRTIHDKHFAPVYSLDLSKNSPTTMILVGAAIAFSAVAALIAAVLFRNGQAPQHSKKASHEDGDAPAVILSEADLYELHMDKSSPLPNDSLTGDSVGLARSHIISQRKSEIQQEWSAVICNTHSALHTASIPATQALAAASVRDGAVMV